MPRLVWANPNNWRQMYITASYNDPNVPAGYVLEDGSDGAPTEALQEFMEGVNSGGFPAYRGDANYPGVPQRADYPNGILFDGKVG